MRITEIEAIPVDVPFKQPFVVWRGTIPFRRHVLVRIATDDGITGWGEGAPFFFYAAETAADVESMVTDYLAPELIGKEPRDIRSLMAGFAMIDGHEFAKCAVETALWDILAQAVGLPLYRLLGGAYHPNVPLVAVLHTGEPEEMAEEARAWVARGFRTLKIKLGFGAERDEANVAAARAAVGPAPLIRVDAEEHYALKEALAIARRIERFGIELISQPVARTDWEGMALLRTLLPMPLLADEGIHSPADVMHCVRAQAADMVNIKVLKSGGLLASLEMAAICQANHLPIVVGSMIETGIGTLLAAHFALVTRGVFSTELCGPLLYQDDLLDRSLAIHDGAIWLDERPGLGAAVDPVKLERFRSPR
jgi:L-alanine-DL-glutamate epimerase-like enolase superfamily enzyme